jgi:hypothetical protein
MAKARSATKDAPQPVTPATEGLEPADLELPPEGEATYVLQDEPAATGDGQGGQGTEADKAPADGDGTRAPEGDTRDRNLRAALKEARVKRRDLLAELETERALRRQAEEARAAADERARNEAARAARLAKIDEVNDLSEAVPLIREDVVLDVEGRVRPVMDRALALAVRNSQAVAASKHADFFDVLEASGVQAAITLTDGKPGDPDIYRKIFAESLDPGEDAYRLAQQLLARQEGREPTREPDDEAIATFDEPAGDRAQGRREILDQLDRTAQRPRGIGGLPSSGYSGPQKLTRRQIDAMSDQQRSRLPEHVIEWWLSGSEVIQR